ncbi:efflux RND transporter periplasmic adaptor subunit [Gramella jeungdoensis]|uniref:Efflux RND transporter periplasmic adaptor subunit n=1 Tax=Gramella jeungdoensis TaxID=708091 RepID=A0ABT0Z8E0_9FLAO|nr:efflux RND transporter periplasmic adaptor subunit [Gramella jeungdoensis]MCM8571019.1 efflux RND transporter periplasmic adaptor subunit [Gramella jeungdoensis]
MKKYITYIVVMLAGLLLGYLIFNNSSEGSSEVSEAHEHSEEVQMWTCSMHPQIMQPEPGDCPICGMDLIPAEAGAEGLTADEFKMTENAMTLANIQTSVVGNADATPGKINLSGKIKENEEANAVQSSHVGGRIENLSVAYTGESVNRGQLLATIYSPDLVAAQQELLTAAKLKESQPALYKAVRNKLKYWKLSDAQIDKIESTGEVRENLPVYATVTGTVTEKLVQEGDYVKQGQPLYKIANLNTVWAVFDAYESQISNLNVGQELKITANAYPDKEFSGKISFIDPLLDESSRTVKVRVELKNTDDMLKPGMFVQAELERPEGIHEGSILIPRSAVLWTGTRSLVYVKTSPDEPVFQMKEVKLGDALDNSYEVLEGLSDGDEVVTNGTFTVDAAAQLQGKRSMMNNPKSQKKQAMNMKMELSEDFQKEFVKSLDEYFKLKDALVDSNPEKAMKSAGSMLEKLPKAKLQGMAAAHFNKVKEMLEAISKNENLENQRAHFVILSENMIALTANIDSLGQAVYVQHCPMADSNKGADWLSLSSEVRNPYYGEAMLSCGEVTKELK